MKLLIAPWGDPGRWSETTYRFEGEEYRGRSSLGPLRGKIEPDLTLIVVGDTLGEGSGYTEVKESAGSYVRRCLEEFGIDPEGCRICVLPGTGHFPKKRFRGSPKDFYHLLLKELSEIFLKREPGTDGVEVHLDITHGINYMPVLTYRAVRDVLGILAMFSSVRLTVYNADPLVSRDQDTVLDVNVIESVRVSPLPPQLLPAESRLLLPAGHLSPEEKGELGRYLSREIPSDHPRTVAFLGAVANGLPLAVCTFFPDTDSLREMLERAHGAFEEHVEVRKENERLEVTRRIRIADCFETAVKALLTAELIRGSVGMRPEGGHFSLSFLKKLSEEIFRYDRRFKDRIGKDLKEIEDRTLPGGLGDSWSVLNELWSKPARDTVDSRNFIAHSGFERNAVEIRRTGGEIYLRYREKMVDTVRDLCGRGITADR